MTERELRETVVKRAAAYVGAKRTEGGHRQFCDTYNRFLAQNRKKLGGYPRNSPMSYDYAWCSCFASAIAIELGLAMDWIPAEISCCCAVRMWQALNRWAEADDYIPQPGDYIYFDHDGSVSTDSPGASATDHVGIVERVEGSVIHTIEGNITIGGFSQVGRRTHRVNGADISGFGVPDYAAAARALTEAAGGEERETGGKAPAAEHAEENPADEKAASEPADEKDAGKVDTNEKDSGKKDTDENRSGSRPDSRGSADESGSADLCALKLPIARRGSRGESIRALQALLNLRCGCGLDLDGSFGSKTLAGVKRFQKAAGIAADGVAGPVTWGALIGGGA